MESTFRVIEWERTHVTLLDQRVLPVHEQYIRCSDWREVATAIKEMVVRGAPAIGITAAYGIVLGARQLASDGSLVSRQTLRPVFEGLGNTRPTAVNLFWALNRMTQCLDTFAGDPVLLERLEAEAILIHDEDRRMCAAMGDHGAQLLPERARLLTHCNTGALATGGDGTALAVIRSAHRAGRLEHVYADETRPFLQGSRLTAWELHRDGVPLSVITDSMAADFMRRGAVDAVVVGTDRVAANGDVANKIGTYGLAVLCRAHGIPFYVVGPTSTIDLDTPDGLRSRSSSGPIAKSRTLERRDRTEWSRRRKPSVRRHTSRARNGHHYRAWGRPTSVPGQSGRSCSSRPAVVGRP